MRRLQEKSNHHLKLSCDVISEYRRNIGGLYVAWMIAASMLVFAAVDKHPYSFYTLLRWICCPVFAYSAAFALQTKREAWVWIFGVLAALYNPIIRVHLDRGTWVVVNWMTAGVIALAAVLFWRERKDN